MTTQVETTAGAAVAAPDQKTTEGAAPTRTLRKKLDACRTDRLRPMLLVTHDEDFHADDVLAVAILDYLPIKWEVVRTHDPKRIARAVVRVDVGGRYDPGHGWFDHHQPNAPTRSDGSLYSSAGLIWDRFGSQVVHEMLKEWGGQIAKVASKEAIVVRRVCDRVTDRLIRPVDLHDNGGPTCAWSEVIAGHNPQWWQTAGMSEVDRTEEYVSAFWRMVRWAQLRLRNEIASAVGEELALRVVADATWHEDGRILELRRFAPWQRVLIEDNGAFLGAALYVVYPTDGDRWNVQAIPLEEGSRRVRRPFPESWRGLDRAALRELTRCPSALFAHNEGHLVSASSKSGALKLARLAASTEG